MYLFKLLLFILFVNMYILTYSCLASDLEGNVKLDIDNVYRDKDKWCWAACCEMILTAYGESTTQREVAEYKWPNENPLPNEFNRLYGGEKPVSDILQHFGSINSNFHSSPLTIFIGQKCVT